MAHPLVEGLGIAELERTLVRLTAHPHVVQSTSSAPPSSHDIDAIHRGLLQKQRQSGSLGLNK